MAPVGVPSSTITAPALEGYRTGLRPHGPIPHRATFGPRPFALEPLRRALELQVGDRIGLATLASALGVNDRQVHRWSRNGLTEAQADELAARIGHHPGDLWPDWWTT